MTRPNVHQVGPIRLAQHERRARRADLDEKLAALLELTWIYRRRWEDLAGFPDTWRGLPCLFCTCWEVETPTLPYRRARTRDIGTTPAQIASAASEVGVPPRAPFPGLGPTFAWL